MRTAGRLRGGLAALTLTALAVAGCAAPSGGGPGGTPSSQPVPGGLRGTEVVAVECKAAVAQPDAAQARTLPGAPARIVICPLPMPNAAGPPVDLRPAPPALVQALSLPDAPRPTGQYACPAYADVPRLIYAELADGSLYLLHIPVDECSHYLGAALKVVAGYAHDGPVVS